MTAIYSPLILVVAVVETREARHVSGNRARGEADDEAVEEWEEMQGELDVMGGGWSDKVEKTIPNVEEEAAVVGLRDLKRQVDMLTALVRTAGGAASSSNDGEGDE